MCGCRGLQSSSGGVWGPLEVSYEGVNQQMNSAVEVQVPRNSTLTHTDTPILPHVPDKLPPQTHLIRGLLVLRGGQLHGDGSLYILVGGPLPLTLPSDHMIVVDLALGVSGCLPVPGEV